jgi:hypothetical protein
MVRLDNPPGDVGGRFAIVFLESLFYLSSTSSSHSTMDPSCAKGISDLVQTKFEWKQEKLVFSLAIHGNKPVEFDVVPYLEREVLKVTSLSFCDPIMDQNKDLIALFKQQALKEGVHLLDNRGKFLQLSK